MKIILNLLLCFFLYGAGSAQDRIVCRAEALYPCMIGERGCDSIQSHITWDDSTAVFQWDHHVPLASFRLEKMLPETKEYESYPSEMLCIDTFAPATLRDDTLERTTFDIVLENDEYVSPELFIVSANFGPDSGTFYIADAGTFFIRDDGIYMRSGDAKGKRLVKIRAFLFYKEESYTISNDRLQAIIKEYADE